MRADAMGWRQQGDRAWVMDLADGGAEWLEVRTREESAGATWRVDARLNGSHYRIGDAFATKEQAQGSALLLAMRLLPTRRPELHAQLDAVPEAWWWKIVPPGDAGAEQRSIFSSRVVGSAEAAERSGRAAGAGWSLYVYGPGSAREFGQLPR